MVVTNDPVTTDVFSLEVVYRLQTIGDWPTTASVGVSPSPYPYGYFGGGFFEPSAEYSTVDRIDYSNDTATASVRGPLSLARAFFTATGNGSYGYFGGGYATPPNVAYSRVDRIDYSNDTATASTKGPLGAARYLLAATGNGSYGYFGGGIPANTSRVDRIDYSNDTATASPKGPLSVARYGLAATGNSSYGYFGGGFSPTTYSRVDRIDYSNDTATASVKGPLSLARYNLAATGNSSFGYFGGGRDALSTVDRIDYSNDTATASVRGPLSVARVSPTATGNGSFGYFGGGSIGYPNQLSTVDRIEYSNDTATASPKGPLSSVKYNFAATGNSNFGYFGGGRNDTITPSDYSTVDRIDYSNDTATASPKGPLTSAKRGSGATGNSSFGYFGGAGTYPGPILSTVDRIDYSNDTATASLKGPLSAARRYLGATGNSNFGYFAGGFSPIYSTVDRIDYSNDTSTASPKGPLSVGRGFIGATAPEANGIANPLPAPPAAPQLITSGLVLNLDAGDSSSYPGSGTTWYDLSGNGNNGTLFNGVGYNSSNLGSLSFDGTNDYSTIPDITGVTDFSTSNNYTVDFWTYLSSTQNNTQSADNDVVEKWSASGGGYPYVFRYIRSTQLMSVVVYDGSSVNSISIQISHSNWWNICGVFNWSSSLLTVYGNGGSVTGSTALNLTGDITNNSALNLMRRGNGFNYATGNLSMLKIYNRALTASEVQQNFNVRKSRYGL